jgi:hypothetical protein
MNRNVPYLGLSAHLPIWIGCFSIAVMLLLSVSVPVQFSDARYKDAKHGDIVIQDLFNDCDHETSYENIGAIGNDGSAIAQTGGLGGQVPLLIYSSVL